MPQPTIAAPAPRPATATATAAATAAAAGQVIIPEQCLLNPSPEAAVVGGNVLTSQRVTDVVLKAFGAAAASQVPNLCSESVFRTKQGAAVSVF